MSRKDFKSLFCKEYEKDRLRVYFSVDYDYVAVDDILDIHKYLMEKNGIA